MSPFTTRAKQLWQRSPRASCRLRRRERSRFWSALKNERLMLSHKPEIISGAPIVIITIGTPVDEFLSPVLVVFKECMDELMPHLTDGQLLVLRSTVYPGTTNWLDRYLKKCGKNVKVA